jgi:hypothetical protein
MTRIGVLLRVLQNDVRRRIIVVFGILVGLGDRIKISYWDALGGVIVRKRLIARLRVEHDKLLSSSSSLPTRYVRFTGD